MRQVFVALKDALTPAIAPLSQSFVVASVAERERQRKSRLLRSVLCCAIFFEIPVILTAIFSFPIGVVTGSLFEIALLTALFFNRRAKLELAVCTFMGGYLLYTTTSQFLYSPDSSVAFHWEWIIFVIPVLLVGMFLPFWAPILFGTISVILNTAIYLLWQGKGHYNQMIPASDHLDLIMYMYVMTFVLSAIGAIYSYSIEKAVKDADRAVELQQAYAQVSELNTSLTKANTRLQEIAMLDPITGLLNHRALNDFLAAATQRSRHAGQPIGVIFGNIDHFKRINDTWGHSIGDQALKHIAGILQNNTRAIDLLARYGGEEFVVILPGLERVAIRQIAERLRETIAEQPLTLADGTRIMMTMSIGIATYPDDGEKIADVLIAADAAMYCAKRLGRNRVCDTADDRADLGDAA